MSVLLSMYETNRRRVCLFIFHNQNMMSIFQRQLRIRCNRNKQAHFKFLEYFFPHGNNFTLYQKKTVCNVSFFYIRKKNAN